MTEITKWTLAETRKNLDNKTVTSLEVTQSYLKRIEQYSHLNCYITQTADLATLQAKAADKAIADGDISPLTGVPLGIKDLFCTKGVLTTAASHILDGFVPEYESTITTNFWQQKAVMLGKLNLDEFAMGSANETSYYGAVKNPYRKKSDPDMPLVPGGSSGGSSAAVSADLCVAATGTDTGGSIRQPASFTGIVGLKPTYGRCSRWGVVAFASSLDQAGPMTKTVEDAAIMLGAMAGYDPKDATSSQSKVPDFTQNLKKDLRGLKIGIPKEYYSDDLSPQIVESWQKAKDIYQSLGAQIIDISLPHTHYALPAYYIIAPAEASSNLARYDGVRYGLREDGDSIEDMYVNTRTKGFGEEVKRRIMIGTFALSSGYYDAYYKRAQRVRACISNDFKQAFEKVNMILTPSTPTTAFEINRKNATQQEAYFNDIYTVPVNLAGLPALSLPVGHDLEGLPLGIQLIGRHFDEETILNAAYHLEENIAFTRNISSAI